MSQPTDDHGTPTPDYEALRDTRPEAERADEDRAGSAQGPATAGENVVEETLGGADPREG